MVFQQMQAVVYTALVLIGYSILKTVISGLRSPIAHVPGPWHTRFSTIGNTRARLRGRKHEWTHSLHKRYGPVVRIAPTEVCVNQPADFQTIHRMGSGFSKGPIHASVRFPLGDPDAAHNLFSLQHAKPHSERRRVYARALTATSLRQNWEPQIREVMETGVRKIHDDAENGTADVFKWWRLVTGDVIALLAFGKSFGMAESGRKTRYVEALELAGVGIMLNYVAPWVLRASKLVVAWLPEGKFKTVVEANKIMHRQASRAVEAVKRAAVDDTGRERGNLFTQAFASLEESDNRLGEGPHGGRADGGKVRQPLTDDDIRSDTSMFMYAGSDTTANTLTFLTWAVLKKPDLQLRLEEEVTSLPDDFDDIALEKLPLLNAVINETLRMYDPAAGPLSRVIPEGGMEFNGIFLPEGLVVNSSIWESHRNEDAFPNPYVFDEMRWFNPNQERKKSFVPWNIGARACLGLHLAQMELRLATALFFRVCRGAKIAKTTPDEDMEPRFHFVLFPKGMHCDVTLRAEELS